MISIIVNVTCDILCIISGKTHTMFGPPGSISQQRGNDIIGIIPRAINDIFLLTQDPDVKQFSVLCSFVQLYNENCYDMLCDSSMGSALAIREDVTGEIYVQGLSEYIVKSIGDTLHLLRTAEENRAIRETNMNQYSSRSHSIFQIMLEQKKTAADGGEITLKAKFNLVDLAGSEKWNTKQDMTNDHISEMTNINLSLHTLGKCISVLVKRSKNNKNGGGGGNNTHIPYRESKLTRLLQDSLGGNSRTFLIATVSPSSSNVDESINTLKFADRAKQVMVQAKVNESRPIDHAMVKSLQTEVRNLKGLLQEVSVYVQGMVVSVSGGNSPIKAGGSGSGLLEDAGMAEGGTFLTNHNGRTSGRLAFQEDEDPEQRNNMTPTSKNNIMSINSLNGIKKAALFQAIELALGGRAASLVMSTLHGNNNITNYKQMPQKVASYTPAIPFAALTQDGSIGSGDNESSEMASNIARLSDTIACQTRQLEALERKEMHTWHLLEAVQVHYYYFGAFTFDFN